MYITRDEIERLFETTTYFSEAYKDAESSLHNNIGDVYDLDTELRKSGATRNVVIFTLFYHLIGLNMALKGNKKIDYSKCFDLIVRIITELKIVQIVSGSNVSIDTSSFDKQLSGNDDTVQKALNTLDKLVDEAPEDDTTYGRKNAGWNALAAVAVSGNYSDLSGTPDLGEYEKISNKRTSFQDTPDDTHYISEKLAKDTFDEKQDSYTAESITIAVADWSGLTAIKTVPGVTAINLILLGFNKANGDLLSDYNVKMDSQDTNELTFKADETPEEDISLTIVIFD